MKPNPIDIHVGARIRMRRMMLGMSQEKLAVPLSVTWQQLQKYEKGTNRVAASRLQQIATTLQVPISFFFDGAPGANVKGTKTDLAGEPDLVGAFFSLPHAAELAKLYVEVANNVRRRAIVEVARAIVEGAAEGARSKVA